MIIPELEVLMVDLSETALLLAFENYVADVATEMEKLFILLLVVEWNYWDAVLELVEVRVRSVVHQQHVRQLPAL